MTFQSFKWAIVVLFLGIQLAFAQTPDENVGVEEKPKVFIDGHDYPSFGDGSNFAWFEIHFPLTETSEIGVGGEHYRTFFADRFNVPIRYKKFISEKSYFFGGYQLEWDLLNEGAGRPNPTPMQEVFFGVGYEVKPNMFLETRFVQPIGTPEFNKVGYGIGLPRLEFGGKWKF
ncbi:hypothetical protein [Flagellimonas sp.]|uniref:hypothetical protein n=1 Tax=Flagellimonas sp. TaxID=2058762 RepID=UPI003F4A482E